MKQFWLAFSLVKGMGSARLRHVRNAFESMEAAWFADAHTLRAIGLPTGVVENHQQLRKSLHPEKELNQVYASGAWIVTLDDTQYPTSLRQIDDPPALLYGCGSLIPSDERAVGVVGTRKATGYGKQMTRSLVQELVANDITIISGLARGIDIIAHRTTLEAGGRTIAVLGSGIDVLYPHEHRDTAIEILSAGVILTELPLGTQPLAQNFPARNRLISGLSLGIVVVEAPENSGALQTASIAAEQGREVFAVPGNADSAASRGTNQLIRDGARLVLSAQDIIEELNLRHQNITIRRTVQEVIPADDYEKQILQHLMNEPIHVDELCRLCEKSIQEINTSLVMMELKGLVYQTAPNIYHVTEMIDR